MSRMSYFDVPIGGHRRKGYAYIEMGVTTLTVYYEPPERRFSFWMWLDSRVIHLVWNVARFTTVLILWWPWRWPKRWVFRPERG